MASTSPSSLPRNESDARTGRDALRSADLAGTWRSPEHTFTLDASSRVSCRIAERALRIRQASGTEGQGGLIDAHLSAADADGRLVVIELHGTGIDRRYLDMAPRSPAPVIDGSSPP